MSKKLTNEQIESALKKHSGNKTAAAAELGVSRGKIWRYCKNRDEGNVREEETTTQRKLRKAESKARKLEEELKSEKHRRELAEGDLGAALDRNEIVSSLEEEGISYRDLDALQKTKKTGGGCTALILASDFHLEKNVVPSTVSGLNEFNLDIAAQRIDQLWKKSAYLIDLWRNVGDVDEVVLWLGGDIIHGHLHDEDVETNFCGPTEAVLLAEEHLATGIEHLSKTSGLDRVVCNVGNHGRTTHRMRPGTNWKHSLEYIVYKHLESAYPDLDWSVPKGDMVYEVIQGKVIRFLHGHTLKYHGGIMGLGVPARKAIAAWDKSIRADLTVHGHFHQFSDSWNWVSNGCVCGFDAYAASIKSEFQPPTQTLVFIDKDRGKVASLPIFVEKARGK